MAEIELKFLISQCLGRRIDNIEDVKREVSAWQKHRNNRKAIVNWQFTAEDARIKLTRLYPHLIVDVTLVMVVIVNDCFFSMSA